MQIPDKAVIEFKPYKEGEGKNYTVKFNPPELTFQVSQTERTPEGSQPPQRRNFQIRKEKEEEPRQILEERQEEVDITMSFKLTADTSLDEKQSVKEDVEGLLSAIRNPLYKEVCFHWGRLKFPGELTSVSAEYVMFHPDGRPCRAYIDLSIKNKREAGGKPLWEKEYQALLKNGTGRNKKEGKAILSIHTQKGTDCDFHVQYNPNTLALKDGLGLTFELLIDEQDGVDVLGTISGFLGMFAGGEVKKAAFSWGGMSYRGKISLTSAGFQMFGQDGNPLRGSMKFALMQEGGFAEQDNYWSKAYKNIPT